LPTATHRPSLGRFWTAHYRPPIGLMTGSIEATSIGAATDVAGKISSDGQ
jgi:hypothetical protein